MSFNSTMVRLKDPYAHIFLSASGFQFHYGSIKGFTRKYSLARRVGFNSTMVRLKDNGW